MPESVQARESGSLALLDEKLTVVLLAQLAHDVQRLVLLQGLTEQDHFLLRLDALVLGVGAATSADDQFPRERFDPDSASPAEQDETYRAFLSPSAM